ncbi:MAG: phosphotransferase [Bacteroidales bacterium]|nr:phosphotransferase [Bacteroidales bacterium]
MRQGLSAILRTLTRFLLDAGQEYFLFRDFQTANIMLRDGKPWYIDYQGGRLGAPHYDIASLVYDAKAYIPDGIRQKTLDRHLDLFSVATGQVQGVTSEVFGCIHPHQAHAGPGSIWLQGIA